MQAELEVTSHLFADDVLFFAPSDLDLWHLFEHLAADYEEAGVSTYTSEGLMAWFSPRKERDEGPFRDLAPV